MSTKRKASPAESPESKRHAVTENADQVVEEPTEDFLVECFVDEETVFDGLNDGSHAEKKERRVVQVNEEQEGVFSGETVRDSEAREKWPHRYIIKVCFVLHCFASILV